MPERNEVLICAPDNLVFKSRVYFAKCTDRLVQTCFLSFVKHGKVKYIAPQCEMEVMMQWFVL